MDEERSKRIHHDERERMPPMSPVQISNVRGGGDAMDEDD